MGTQMDKLLHAHIHVFFACSVLHPSSLLLRYMSTIKSPIPFWDHKKEVYKLAVGARPRLRKYNAVLGCVTLQQTRWPSVGDCENYLDLVEVAEAGPVM